VQELFSGPIDIIGDVHGECGTLCKLLDRLGYDGNGQHADGRRLVFVGDLIDRGPDSPGVVRLVRHLIAQGNAQCVMGNHELNILRGERKHGNHWFFGEPEVIRKDKFAASFQVLCSDQGFRAEVLEFFESLPVALEREDVGIVHACWNSAALERIRRMDTTVCEAFKVFEAEVKAKIALEGIEDPDQLDMIEQNDNPIKCLCSGREVMAPEPFFAGGKMRNLMREMWWEDHEAEDGRLVVIGHYWRRFMDEVSPAVPAGFSPTGDDLFPMYKPSSLVGKKKKVMCIDFAAGVRYEERGMGLPETALGTHLAALRHPEMTVHLEDGRIMKST